MATRTPTTRRTTPARKTTTRAAATLKTSKTVTAPARGTQTKPAKAPGASVAVPRVVKPSGPAAIIPDLKKKELLEQVVARSGIKKKDAKPVVEAMLAVLGETLAEGRELNLQPLGKLRINRSEEKTGYRIVVCKLRQSTRSRIQGSAPLADGAE
jgi:nucleoid DNA-binding protein